MSTTASAEHHSLFVDTTGNVWGCGFNENGQLGHGDRLHRNKLTKNPNLRGIALLAATGYHSLFLDRQHRVWSCGNNYYGQLGLQDEVTRLLPTRIENIPPMKSVACGAFFSLFLDFEGNVWASGSNEFGQLGLGDIPFTSKLIKIENLPEIKNISAAQFHSVLLDIDGRVWVCGSNEFGQLPLLQSAGCNQFLKISNLPESKMVATGETHSLFLDFKGRVWTCGNNELGQLGSEINSEESAFELKKIKDLPEIQTVACGSGNSIFLDNSGGVWVSGALGSEHSTFKPHKLTGISKIESVTVCAHALLLDTDGKVWGLGDNGYHQLGVSENNLSLPEKLDSLPEIQTRSLRFKKTKNARF